MVINQPIVVEQTFNASIKAVWNAITEIDQMRQWFFNNIEDFKPEVGFKTQFNITSEKRNFLHLWTITEVEPFKKIVYNWKYKEYIGNSFVHFELFEEKNETKLRVTSIVTEEFPNNIPEFEPESCRTGWDYFIKQNLKEFIKRKVTMNIQIINKSKHELPSYETIASAGVDLRANIKEAITLKPLERTIVKTGLFIALPVGAEAQVRPRSGLAAKKGITVLNAPGTVDADYRGEIGVILVNLSNDDFIINDGERIAQLVIAKHERAEWDVVDVLSETERGTGGFGSTGV